MKAYRVKIYSWTASFRYPNFISGYQPTLEVPPISTILGLINAAAGKFLYHRKLKLGYYFEYGSKAIDLETIYQIEVDEKRYTPKLSPIKSNVINREFLYDCYLFLYLFDEQLVEYLHKPVFQLVLGRSSDLASVLEIKEVDLEEVNDTKCLAGQIVPFEKYQLPGQILPLPKYYTFENPRQLLGTEIYSIIPFTSSVKQLGMISYVDKFEKDEIKVKGCPQENGYKLLNIFIHELKFQW